MDVIRDARLPVLSHYYSEWKDRNVFTGKLLIAVQPLFEDSYTLLMYLKKSGLEIFTVIGLEYSSKPEIREALIKNGINCEVDKTENINTIVLNKLSELLKICETTGKQILILENGGYLVPAIHEHFPEKAYLCAGAVEETKQGLWKDRQILNLLFPVIQTADTDIKKIESSQLGEPVVTALTAILKKAGLGLQGKKIGVLGYGWIGSSVARCLKMRFSHVLAYDINPIKNIEAYYHGCFHGGRNSVLADSDIIIGASGQTSIRGEDFLKLKSGVFIASASSKTIEFDIDFLKNNSSSIQKTGPHITEYHLSETKSIVHLLADGEPINFLIESMPHEIMDLMMADMYMCLVKICQEKLEHRLQPSSCDLELDLANTWIIQRKFF